MPAKLIFLTALLLLARAPVFAERIELGNGTDKAVVTVLESNDNRTVVNFRIDAFDKEPVIIDNEEYYLISLDGESIHLEKSTPSLPRICRSIIIPDNAAVRVNIIDREYTDFVQTPVAPSKGNLLRTVNPADIAYTFGDVYNTGDWYPASIADIREPFILRDYRGTVIDLNAFQYNHASRTLRVYTSVTVEVVSIEPGKTNILDSAKRAGTITPEFEQLYKRRFINYSSIVQKYAPIVERGDMLIITYDEFRPEVEPLAEWKRQKGIRTWIVDISEIGNDGDLIAEYIRQFYEADSTNLAFVLLVGDHYQINKPVGSGNSDPVYSTVAGSDDYPDFLIGRFSAESINDVRTQVERTIAYEKYPDQGEWYHRGTGIGSDDANVGQGGEHDWEHIDLIRDDLLGFTYTEIDQLYEHLEVTSSDLTAVLHEGRSIVNYTGHGLPTSWMTTGFSNNNVDALANTGNLPFIFSVACNNGQFDIYTCFAESWMRASSNDSATGAIGFYGSLISQSWTPPMDCQDEAVDLLCASEKTTIGGLCFNGASKMIEMHGSDGANEFDAWAIFGDPSLVIRTDTPKSLAVEHPDSIIFTATEFEVRVLETEGALCALYSDGIIYGSGITEAGGLAVIPITTPLPVGQDITLTVTLFNSIPYIATVTTVSPDGPYLILDEVIVDDAAGGNGNGFIDYGESVTLGVGLKNVGPDTARGVQATIESGDPYITLITDYREYGDIAGEYDVAFISDAFAFDVDPATPDGHQFDLRMVTVEPGTGNTWIDQIYLKNHAPFLEYLSCEIDDESGNGNGILDPGETAELTVTLLNSGSGRADNVAVLLGANDPFITIDDDGGFIGPVGASGGAGDNSQDVFVISADESSIRGHEVALTIAVSAVNGYSDVLQFEIVIGDRVLFFADDFSYNWGWTGLGDGGEWTIGPASGGTGQDGYGYPDPDADCSPTADNWVLGNDLTGGMGGDYNPNMAGTFWVTSPVIDCSEFYGVRMSFMRWLGIEAANYDRAYIQVFNGEEWETIFENPSLYNESSWSRQIYDVSAMADSNPAFQIRFGIGPTDGAWNYCGWNIDDLTLEGYGDVVSSRMAFDIDDVSDSLIPGDIVDDTITVYNLSTDIDLQVRFSSDVDWISCSGEGFYIPPMGNLKYSITINSSGMEAGDYVGNLTYSCNDYSHHFDSVKVHLHLHAPRIELSVSSIEESLEYGGTSDHQITINNTGPGRLIFETECRMINDIRPVSAKPVAAAIPIGTRVADADKIEAVEYHYEPVTARLGGPDQFGYEWIDSDELGGPEYSWMDISTKATSLRLPDDGFSDAIDLGFDFPFYNKAYNRVFIGSNGLLSFESGIAEPTNAGIPDTAAPNNIIAMWWDDLYPPERGIIYYYSDSASGLFVVSFIAIANYAPTGGTGSLTFQAILHEDGDILLQYSTMSAGADEDGLSGATIGIENSEGSDGLEVVYNAGYMKNNLAVLLKAARWISAAPSSGILEPYSSATIELEFDTEDLDPGIYSGELLVANNDPGMSLLAVPVTLTVEGVAGGDANCDGEVDLGDVVYIINHVFKGGLPPAVFSSGDANGDNFINVADAVFLINYLINDGPPPSD